MNDANKGFVALVGAGPGDAGLLTLKGARLLARADAVVYDRLVSPGVLAHISAQAERIDVGKTPGGQAAVQEEICRILIEQAKKGRLVVRLKGGDPYLFGRGGEEAAALCAASVPFCVVPGVTSAIAAPAYAGIPVTGRGVAASLHIVAGHGKNGGLPPIRFEALAQAGGTLVFLMGVETLPQIAAGLLEAGMPGETPAAVIERGTLPAQRRVSDTLAGIAAAAQAVHVTPPAVLVVGETCRRAADFDWFSRLPLFGRRVAVTLPEDADGELAEKLGELGAEVLRCPCTRRLPAENTDAQTQALRALAAFDIVAFTSRTGVETFFSRLQSLGMDARALADCRVAAVAARTAVQLRAYGITADLVADGAGARALGERIARHASPGARVLLWRSARGDAALPRALREAGLVPTDVPAYRTAAAGEPGAEDLAGADVQAFAAAPPDAVFFASASAVKGYLSRTGQEVKKIKAVCIGQTTAAACKAAGILHLAVAKEPDFDAMIAVWRERMKNGIF